MKKIVLATLAVAWLSHAQTQPSAPTKQPTADAQSEIQIPLFPRDQYFQTVIEDAYRMLEFTDAPITKSWIRAQNQATDRYLKGIEFYQEIHERMTTLADITRYGKVKSEKDGHVYYLKFEGAKRNQPVLMRQQGLSGQPELVLDPNTWSPDGTTSLGEYALSGNFKYLAFTKQASGSDKQVAHILDLDSGRILADSLNGLIFSSLAWHGNGFYYQRFPDAGLLGANEYAKIFFHTIGTTQEKDELVFEDKGHPRMMFGAATFDNERWLVITGAQTTSKNALWVRDLTRKGSHFIPIVENDTTADFEVLGISQGKMLVLTNNAPNGHVIEIDLSNPEPSNWRTVLPEQKSSVLHGCWMAGGRLVAHYLVNCSSELHVFDLQGKAIGIVSLPEKIGQVTEFNGASEASEAYFGFMSFLHPASIYRLDMRTLQLSTFKNVQSAFSGDRYETIQRWCISTDGTRIPMFITMKKGTILDGRNPCLQYGYGGFSVPVLPRYSLMFVAWLETGGILCSVNIRGGNEFGAKWHEAGTLTKKQNVFDDFIAASEFLIAEKYTSKELLAINGASNGGLLVGACMTQRPDLYAVCLPQVGVLDMLRFEQSSVGTHWTADYGSVKTQEGFENLLKYSPFHNIKSTTYPATLILTGQQDDRVAPWHSYKFAATLQEKQEGNNPIHLCATPDAGHGTGKSLKKQVDEASMMLAFSLTNMGLDYSLQ